MCNWIKYDRNNKETFTNKYKKYLVNRSNRSICFETWNNTQFAYNNSTITHYMDIEPPKYDVPVFTLVFTNS